MSFSAKRCAYCPRPSFSSQSATLAYADVPISTRVNKPKNSLQRLRWFDFHRHLIRQATKRQSKRGNALGLVSRDSFYSVPAGRRLVGGSLQPRSDAGERSPSHLGCWFDAVEEVRSGPSQATRDVAVAGILKILQPLPARDVSKKMFLPATLLKILRIVCARALQNRKLDPGVTEYKFKIGQLVYSIPKGRASYGHRNRTRSKRLPAREGGEF
jgi:hypothetical protein